jgi:hypothetical protein
MMDMVLTNKLGSGRSWSEVTPADGVHEDSTQSYAMDSAVRTSIFKINWKDLAQCISYMVGYSQCLSVSTNLPYDPTVNQTQSPYYLSRKNPARLPAMPNMRCTRILSVQGRTFPKRGTGAAQAVFSDDGTRTGTIGTYDIAVITAQFEVPKYSILEDDDMWQNASVTANVNAAGAVTGFTIVRSGYGYNYTPTVTISPPPGPGVTATATATITSGNLTSVNLINGGSGYLQALPPSVSISGTTTGAEYLRNCWFTPEVNLETLARKGQTWYFANRNQGTYWLNQVTSPGDRLLRVPKGQMKIHWYNVHEDYIFLGKMFATNFEHRTGTVNAAAFPAIANPNQNKNPAFAGPGALVQKGPGTLLLMPAKITPSAMVHPAVLAGQISPELFMRNVDVEVTALVFDPPCVDITNVNLAGNDYLGFPQNGTALTPVRGHNLVPLVVPVADGTGTPRTWFAQTTQANTLAIIGGNGVNRPASWPVNNTQNPWRLGGAATNPVGPLPRPIAGAALAPLGALILAISTSATPSTIQTFALQWSMQWPNDIGNYVDAILIVQQALGITVGGNVNPITSDAYLTYPYTDFEQLFRSCENMTAPQYG